MPQPRIRSDFWDSVNKTESCWLWLGPVNKQGYGTWNIGSRTRTLAHRSAWVRVKGPIPIGKELHHYKPTCPRICINPDHLIAMGVFEHRKIHAKRRRN